MDIYCRHGMMHAIEHMQTWKEQNSKSTAHELHSNVDKLI